MIDRTLDMNYRIFNVRTYVNECCCTWVGVGLGEVGWYRHRKRVCTESWLWEKNPLPDRGIEPASAACRSDALPTELHPHHLFFFFLSSSSLGPLPLLLVLMFLVFFLFFFSCSPPLSLHVLPSSLHFPHVPVLLLRDSYSVPRGQKLKSSLLIFFFGGIDLLLSSARDGMFDRSVVVFCL